LNSIIVHWFQNRSFFDAAFSKFGTMFGTKTAGKWLFMVPFADLWFQGIIAWFHAENLNLLISSIEGRASPEAKHFCI